MVSAGDFRNGVTLEIDGQVVQILEFQHVKPGSVSAEWLTRILPQVLLSLKSTSCFYRFTPAPAYRKNYRRCKNDGFRQKDCSQTFYPSCS